MLNWWVGRCHAEWGAVARDVQKDKQRQMTFYVSPHFTFASFAESEGCDARVFYASRWSYNTSHRQQE
jgi:hypothetical protein